VFVEICQSCFLWGISGIVRALVENASRVESWVLAMSWYSLCNCVALKRNPTKASAAKIQSAFSRFSQIIVRHSNLIASYGVSECS